jgi:hypothetical protein
MRTRPALRALLTEAAPLLTLPLGVMRQLVGYYSDWRRSRDILSDPDELPARRATMRVPATLGGSSVRALRSR